MKTLLSRIQAWVGGKLNQLKVWALSLIQKFVKFAINAANRQWYIVVLAVLFYLATWNYGYPEANKYGVSFILLVFWLLLVQFKFVKVKEEVKP